MKLRDTQANHVYFTTVYFNDQDPSIESLVYIWENLLSDTSNKVTYEIIACPLFVRGSFFIIGNVELEEVFDLFLYLHLSHKTVTYENLVKGIPVNKKTVLRTDIEFIPLKNNTVSGINFNENFKNL
jgi:hypothetical protein